MIAHGDDVIKFVIQKPVNQFWLMGCYIDTREVSQEMLIDGAVKSGLDTIAEWTILNESEKELSFNEK